jgi:hypothetical protein
LSVVRHPDSLDMRHLYFVCSWKRSKAKLASRAQQ